MRIEVAYRASPYTTANYLVAAFRALGHEVCPTGQGHEGPFFIDPDLFVWVESGGGIPATINMHIATCPSIAWFLDGHSQGGWHKDFARAFTHVYSAQKYDVGEWLPVACDADVHTPDAGIEPTHDVVFVGHLYAQSPWYEKRRMMLRSLAQRYDPCVVEGAYCHDMANAHATGRVVLNIGTLGDLNMRVFEGLCSGRPLVTDDSPGLGVLFTEGEHLLAYTNERELCSAIDYLLANPDKASAMGARGREAVLAGHTYQDRARRMLCGL